MHLKRLINFHRWWWYVINNSLKQSIHIVCLITKIVSRKTIDRRSIDHWKIELFITCTEHVKKIKGLVENPIRTSTFPIYLINNHNRLQVMSKCLLGYKSSLRHWPIDCIDEQNHRINHRHNSFYFATKVGMARRIDNVYSIVVPNQSGRFCKNSNASFFFDVITIHYALNQFCTLVKGT